MMCEVKFMEEKKLRAKAGMPMLILFIILYFVAIGLIILGGILLDANIGIGALPLILGVLWVFIGVIPFFWPQDN
jgi:hypothetical protein